MKSKGFTLVELLAVIVILALLIIIVITNGFGVFDKTKGSINKLEENNLIEAAKVFLVDVDNGLVAIWPDGCDKTSFINNYCNVTVGYLKENEYFDDKDGNCKNELSLKLKIVKELNGDTSEYIVEKNSDVICVN